MQAYVNNLRQRFGTAANLARFMGVSVHTVKSWLNGRRTPRDVELRFLQVLGLLVTDAPHIFDGFTKPPTPIVLPVLPEIRAEHIASLIESQAAPVKRPPFDFEPSPIVRVADFEKMYGDDPN